MGNGSRGVAPGQLAVSAGSRFKAGPLVYRGTMYIKAKPVVSQASMCWTDCAISHCPNAQMSGKRPEFASKHVYLFIIYLFDREQKTNRPQSI